jgi:hypothetical protein
MMIIHMITQSLINSFFRVSALPTSVMDCAGNVLCVASPPTPAPVAPALPSYLTDWVVIDERFGVRKDNYAINRLGQVKNLKFNKIMKSYYCKSIGYMCVSVKRSMDASGNLIRPNSGYGRKPINDTPRNETLMLVHRLVGNVFIPNSNPHHTVIDHIDGNKLNNDYRNLRWADQRRNANNAKSNKKYWSVRWAAAWNKWAASVQTTINHDPTKTFNHFLGHFDNEEEAARVVKNFMIENYPNEMTGGRRFIE